MFSKTCNHCNKSYQIEDVIVDEHWKSWSVKPAHCYCPHCKKILNNTYPDNVDFIKHLKPAYIIPFVGVLVASFISLATNTLDIVAPVMFAAFGLWLGKYSSLRDHRVIGWFFVGFSVFLYWVFNFAAIS